jgi:hypothetical protein
MKLSEGEERRCSQWRTMLVSEFPTLHFFFWKNEGGTFTVRVLRRTGYTHADPTFRNGETLFEEEFPSLFVGQFPTPEFVSKLALMS